MKCTTLRYRICQLERCQTLNHAILEQYRKILDQNPSGLERSHWFEGRYENLYIPATVFTAIQPVLEQARIAAADFLGLGRLPEVGFWLNDMRPGQVTLRHRHDEDDELLSAAYYVQVPENSGDLVLEQAGTHTRIPPRAGNLVMFPPEVPHEVTRHRGQGMRLSVGMNFGFRD